MFQNNVWNFIKLLWTPLIWATYNGRTETVKVLLDKNGIEFNASSVHLI